MGKLAEKNKNTEAQPKFTGSYKKKSVFIRNIIEHCIGRIQTNM